MDGKEEKTMEDQDKLPGDWLREEEDEPEPEIVFGHGGCRTRIGVLRKWVKHEIELNYVIIFDGEVVEEGYDSLADAKQGAIEFLERKLSLIEEANGRAIYECRE